MGKGNQDQTKYLKFKPALRYYEILLQKTIPKFLVFELAG